MKIQISDKTMCLKNKSFSFKEKLEIARQLEHLQVDTIELPEPQNSAADILLVKTVASFVKNSVLSVSAGHTPEGLKNAVSSLATAARPRIRIEVPVSTVGMEYTCHKKADKMLGTVAALVEEAKKSCNDVELCALDATRAEPDFLKDIILTAIEKGAGIITVCDSAEELMPNDFAAFIQNILTYIPNGISLGVSTANRNGLAVANGICAVKSGASMLKTAVSNEEINLETVGSLIKNSGAKNGFESGLKYTEMHRILKQITRIIYNAENEKSVVTSTDYDQTGIMLDKNDTKDTVAAAVSKLGYDLTADDCDKVYEEFLLVADKKTVTAAELDAVVASVALQVPPTYKLINYVINSGNIISTTAQITVEKNGKQLQGICLGDGPIDAAFLAVEQIVGTHYELDDFQIHSVTEGKQALGSALVKLRANGKLYSGNGISADILSASVRAYINAVNKIVYEEA